MFSHITILVISAAVFAINPSPDLLSEVFPVSFFEPLGFVLCQSRLGASFHISSAIYYPLFHSGYIATLKS